jgi:hypothetical protein
MLGVSWAPPPLIWTRCCPYNACSSSRTTIWVSSSRDPTWLATGTYGRTLRVRRRVTPFEVAQSQHRDEIFALAETGIQRQLPNLPPKVQTLILSHPLVFEQKIHVLWRLDEDSQDRLEVILRN